MSATATTTSVSAGATPVLDLQQPESNHSFRPVGNAVGGVTGDPLLSLAGGSSDGGSDPLTATAAAAKRSWMDSPAFKIIITGAGFMSDAYDLFVLNLVLVIIQYDRPELFAGNAAVKGTLATIVLIGSVLGQLIFGAIADRIGRRIGFIATLGLVTGGALLSATSSDTGAMSLIVWLCIWRFIMGFGIGGEYPLSATVSSENSTHAHRRGRDVATVFSMQGVGMTLAPIMVLFFLSVCSIGSLGTVWRLSLAFGAVPGLLIFYFRVRMHETPHFAEHKRQRQAAAARRKRELAVNTTHGASIAVGADDSPPLSASLDPSGRDSPESVSQASLARLQASAANPPPDPAITLRDDAQSTALTIGNEPAHAPESNWQHAKQTARQLRDWWRELLGAGGSWCIFDIVFYSNGLFSATILANKNKPDPSDASAVHSHLVSTAIDTLYLALLALPGYWCGVLLIDRIGRRRLILIGWICMTITYILMGAVLPALQSNAGAFYFLYGLSFFFCNAGPNVVTFVAPSELFPTSIRATAHGLSAAMGKAGAVVGGALMPLLLDSWGLDAVLYWSGALSVLGLAVSYFYLPETMGQALDRHLSPRSIELQSTQSDALTFGSPPAAAGAAAALEPERESSVVDPAGGSLIGASPSASAAPFNSMPAGLASGDSPPSQTRRALNSEPR